MVLESLLCLTQRSIFIGYDKSWKCLVVLILVMSQGILTILSGFRSHFFLVLLFKRTFASSSNGYRLFFFNSVAWMKRYNKTIYAFTFSIINGIELCTCRKELFFVLLFLFAHFSFSTFIFDREKSKNKIVTVLTLSFFAFVILFWSSFRIYIAYKKYK